MWCGMCPATCDDRAGRSLFASRQTPASILPQYPIACTPRSHRPRSGDHPGAPDSRRIRNGVSRAAGGWRDCCHGRGRCVGPDDGTGPKLFGVSMDVTARKQAEASAAQSGQNWSTSRAWPPRHFGHPDARHRQQPLAILTNPVGGVCSTRPSLISRRCARWTTSARSPSAAKSLAAARHAQRDNTAALSPTPTRTR
jgi:hypothetical protein